MAGFLVRFELTFANLFTEFALMKGESFLRFGIQKLTRQKCPRIVYVHSFTSGRSDRVGGGIEIFNCWKNTLWSSHVWLQGRLAMQCSITANRVLMVLSRVFVTAARHVLR